jgi:tRNA(Leu) C34 or U34 (ribose-2'-O)-methylase TrmL
LDFDSTRKASVELVWIIGNISSGRSLRTGKNNHWYFSKWGTKSYVSAEYSLGDVLVFGSESSGLPGRIWNDVPDQTVRIPIRDDVRSLNLGSAAAVAIFESMRQLEAKHIVQRH